MRPGLASRKSISTRELTVALSLYNHLVVQPAGIQSMLMHHERTLDATFSALADSTRRAILSRLCQGEATVLELAKPFDITQAAVSKHLKVLERAGLITRGRDAQRRPSRLEARALKPAAEWIGTYREFWEASYGR